MPIKKLLLALSLCLSSGPVMTSEKPTVRSMLDLSALEMREKINNLIMSVEAPEVPVFKVENRTVEYKNGSTPVRIYLPNAQDKRPLILLIHGGAWVAGNLDTHDNLARYLCSQVEAAVVSVGYLNSPEGKFPLPLEQCYDALTWSIEHAHEFAFDTTQVAIVGDSAGGNLAAALCLMLREKNGPNIMLQVLINPAPDLTCNGTLEYQNDSLDIMRWQAKHYVLNASDVSNDWVSPLIAKDLSQLPKAVILLAENDPLRIDGQKYANRLKAAGVNVAVYCQPGVGHLAGHGARASLQARDSIDFAVAALKKTFKTHA